MHRNIEILIGKLVTDEDFRCAFNRDPSGALMEARTWWGLDLSAIEMTALLTTPKCLWDRMAQEVDSRLQKASLRQT